MELISFEFLFFSIISIILYFITPIKIKWITLLISSLYFLFYKNFSIVTIIEMLMILITAYGAGLMIDKYQGQKKSNIYLIVSIIIIVSELFILKYSSLIIGPINYLLNLANISYKVSLDVPNSLVGISYYSLMMIGYIVDIHRGSYKAEKNIFKCALFMSYFPILVSGPIIKYGDVKKNLYEGNRFNYHNLCYGLVRILWGIFKILIISQRINLFVDNVFIQLNAEAVGVYSILAILLFPIQLYTNFSGSIDIIMGISRIIGIELPENFKAPFFSTSITEFWRRWHITLGEWLRNYIFYPLLKSSLMQKVNKKLKNKFNKTIGNKVSLYISMLIMWTLIGIWHGGKLTFIIGSGLIQFVFMMFEDILEPITDKLFKKIAINKDVFSYKVFCIIRTYLLFSIALVFFRANSVGQAFEVFKSIFVYNPWVLLDNSSIYIMGIDLLDFRILIIGLMILFVVERLSIDGDVIEKLFKQNIVFRWLIIYALFFFVLIYGWYGPGYNPADFIYANF